MSRTFPNILPSQYVLLHAEVDTGMVLTPAGELAIGLATPYVIFETCTSLAAYALAKIRSCPDIECVAYDDQQRFIKAFRNDAAILARAKPNKNS